MKHVQDFCYIKLPLPKNMSICIYLKKNEIVFKVWNFLVRFPQRQASYEVTEIVSHTVGVFLANIDQE